MLLLKVTMYHNIKIFATVNKDNKEYAFQSFITIIYKIDVIIFTLFSM